jgi:hypothetical protein
MADRATQKAIYARGGAEVADWIYAYEPERDWDKAPLVPAIE